jgi:predicted nucleotidyltransferase component of viral defense system
MSAGLAQSVQARLVGHAKKIGVDPNLILARYASERLLYRLSRSRYAERFILKGALLLLVWFGETIRPTRDVDLLGFGDISEEALRAAFAEICGIEVEPDGMTFDASSIRVDAIRPEDDYGGQRVTLFGHLGPAHLRVQVDVGIGDAVSPEPEWLEYPSLLDLPRPRLRAYRPETAISEKVHAMVVLGAKNSRMRDFFDVHVLATRESFDGDVFVHALRATFQRRNTVIPTELPVALTPAFADVEGKRAQWSAFLSRIRPPVVGEELGDVIAMIAKFVGPALAAAAGDQRYPYRWCSGGPWTLSR